MKIEMDSSVGLALIVIGIGVPALGGLLLCVRAFLVGFNKTPKKET